jgi:small subunit ribosomal protein S7
MRKKRAPKRQVAADPKYQDVLVARFVNSILRRGKKHLARSIFYDSLKLAEERTQQNGLDVFRKAMKNVQPILEVRARRVGGATYQVPTEVRQDRGTALAIRWLLSAARGRKDKSMSLKLAAELVAAAGNEGNAVKKKEDTHKMAEANKAFAHFRW